MKMRVHYAILLMYPYYLVGFVSLFAVNLHATSFASSPDLSKMHCGVHVIYMAAKWFHKTYDLGNIANDFPGIDERGISLLQVSEKLRELGFRTQLARVDTTTVLNNRRCIFVLFSEIRGQGVGHFQLAIPAHEGHIQVLDPFALPEYKLVNTIEALPGVIVSEYSSPLPVFTRRTNVSSLAAIIFFLAGMVFLVQICLAKLSKKRTD